MDLCRAIEERPYFDNEDNETNKTIQGTCKL